MAACCVFALSQSCPVTKGRACMRAARRRPRRGVGRGGAVVALRGLPGCELWERWVSRPRIVSVHRYSTLSTHDFLRRSLACIAYGIVALLTTGVIGGLLALVIKGK